MARDLHPSSGMLIANYLVTLGILGAIIYLSIGKPKEYYYATPYNDHEGSSVGYASVACVKCHGEPFTPVVNTGCATTECHSNYMEAYQADFAPPIYEPGWMQLKIDNPRELAKKRAHVASLEYHKLPQVAEMNCADCHVTHLPPPAGVPKVFPHSDPNVLPEGVSITNCAACHGLKQAPPIGAHHAMIQSGIAECWNCHHSTQSWAEDVTTPEGLTERQAADPYDGEPSAYESLPTPVPTPEPTPLPTGFALNPFADAPPVEPENTLPPPTPTPAPVADVDLNWLTLWYDYKPGLDLAAPEKPVLLMFTNKQLLDSNRFEIYFERAREALRYAAGNMVLVRVDTAEFPDMPLQYRLPGAPGLVRLDGNGQFHSRFFAGDGRVPEERLLEFLKAN
ncbi:hypothetical protein KQI84_04465 [bacterium]|nr:hypothetical protein [bacterium]